MRKKYFKIGVLIVIATIFCASNVFASGVLPKDEYEIWKGVNGARESVGTKALKRSHSLDEAANIRAKELAESYSHDRPDGSDFSTIHPSASGENAGKGWGVNGNSIYEGWMQSGGHKRNILNPDFQTMGIGSYTEGEVNYYITLFARAELEDLYEPEEPTPEEPTPEEPTPDEPVPDEPVPDNPVPDNPVPDNPVPDNPVVKEKININEPITDEIVSKKASNDKALTSSQVPYTGEATMIPTVMTMLVGSAVTFAKVKSKIKK